ncbi:hypothetical protein H310_07005 [Aphanomyces invadans]|uniref:Branchpoint-bridging protein n=1 Tax=Aphanomyces invadans TaxID=157072 RepID=A0A024U2C3_9STRA|nr:hypothetical protein H310_07005 [Aphanomyces invadans]ETW00360.1 hypothetical protein H310_07005 [Aphanomyces invadans]|eukprot:XP_008870495.1 hypothetical protein H310_07005 [Aphanomyces invadans]
MENDPYAQEEEMEREALMRASFQPMKKWYADHPEHSETYGPFPLFWQDLKTWGPHRDVQRLFLKATETASDSQKASPEDGGDSGAKPEQPIEEDAAAKGKRRRKSKWDQDGDEPSNETPTTINATAPARKSRWGAAVESNETEEAPPAAPKKKSRWAPVGSSADGPAVMSAAEQQSIVLRAKLDALALKMATVVQDAAIISKDPNRSPSPPPVYDSMGKKLNTREARMRAAYESQRMDIIGQLVQVNPLFKPPPEYLRARLQRKLPIPHKEYPTYNFIGLIIGPRGNTQKRMEKEFNCRIAIRGRGSVKEGSKGKKMMSDDHEELHVLITGDREEDIERAAKEVARLLEPIDDTNNAHKQKQLRELALINGTLRDDDYCHICGEKGHRQWECPNRDKAFKPVDVRCAICGDTSHPTSDCTQKGGEDKAVIDKEYLSFMEQLGESKPNVISTATITATTTTETPPATTQATAQGWNGAATVTPVAIGTTPETAFPPPTAATAAVAVGYGGYYSQQAQWDPVSQQWVAPAAAAVSPEIAAYYAQYFAAGWTLQHGVWYDATGTPQGYAQEVPQGYAHEQYQQQQPETSDQKPTDAQHFMNTMSN